MPSGLLAPSVGGMLELHYGQPDLGPVYPLRLAVTLFDPSPSGPQNDYPYTGAGGFTPGETGVLATVANLAACWAPYYDASWSLELAEVYHNVSGVPVRLPVRPTMTPYAGAASAPVTGLARAKRSIGLYTSFADRWRVWLRQLEPAGVGETVPAASSTGGIDARDQAWYAYVAGTQSALVGRDGSPFRAGGNVRAWWDTPPAPYLVSG